MARLPYADLSNPACSQLVKQIIAERGSVLHLYQMLLHSPPIARGWLTHLTAIRQQSSLPGSIRELIIMRIAHLNRAPYEAHQHAPIALAEGLSQQQLDALENWNDTDLFDEHQRAVLTYTDSMTLNVQVSDDVFNAITTLFTPAEVVELTATIATYNMVSRFLEALQIHSDDPRV
ncbi:carboxymuconolactone decarboxylase family protein [Pusillimonas sp. (ex Stolz et al. 2005)]|uniref:carboxymuconolactone decarboxylase family protein n=1 Tax=Pusillimonas sp. (ex Stolz et al. 2005) TaxID=1979962 RepID=UPI0026235232|nr:carboxymuconolactone decarboxylase family protein [Pusillimonas sp. (ex Stolz et al. 2005)]